MSCFLRFGKLLRCLPPCVDSCVLKCTKHREISFTRMIHWTRPVLAKGDQKVDYLPAVHYFDVKKKDKETFNQAIEIFVNKDPRRRGHVEFILAALEYMEEFGVDHDIESYKNLIKVLPEGKMVPTNVFQSEFMHFPKQQNCAVLVLDNMERKGICPDQELGDLLKARFGRTGIPVRKWGRMMYWMPKFMHRNPWPVARPTPKDPFSLAKLAIERIMSVDKLGVVSVLNTAEVPDSLDDTWIVSGQSPKQQTLIERLPDGAAVYVEGPTYIWLRNLNVQYFILRADPIDEPEPESIDLDDVSNLEAPWMIDQKQSKVKPIKSVHEQDDGQILSVCATGTSSRDSLLSWIRLLEKENPRLATLPVLFRIRSSPKGEIVAVEN